MSLPTPHLEKLNSVLENDRLPEDDAERVKQAKQVYSDWIENMSNVDPDDERGKVIQEMTRLLNEYKKYIEVDLVFDSDHQYLYRYKGQIKLENTIIEEFLPHLVTKAVPELDDTFDVGPQKCFSSVHFESGLGSLKVGGNPQIKTKDQDFSISRKLFLRSSHDSDFADSVQRDTYLGYVCAECKTNLDKTMFQEAVATAHDVKSAVPGAKYFLLCEWLDMTPISTAPTDIDEVIILRKGKRLNSNVRDNYGTPEGRRQNRTEYVQYLEDHPFREETFSRLVNHIVALVNDEDPEEDSVLLTGFF